MPIVPDTKDWTWVLERRCPECGFDASSVPFGELPDLLRASAEPWPDVLRRADASVRPDDHTWSPLEYACHVRDVCRVFEVRLALMLTEGDPLFENWDQDATAVADRYSDQDPATVATELVAAGESLATHFAAVAPTGLDRRGRRSDGAVFTVETLGRYLSHDPVHHLHDVGVDVSALTTTDRQG